MALITLMGYVCINTNWYIYSFASFMPWRIVISSYCMWVLTNTLVVHLISHIILISLSPNFCCRSYSVFRIHTLVTLGFFLLNCVGISQSPLVFYQVMLGFRMSIGVLCNIPSVFSLIGRFIFSMLLKATLHLLLYLFCLSSDLAQITGYYIHENHVIYVILDVTYKK